MKTEILIIIFYLTIGCNSKKNINNQKMITSIDSLKISKTITEVETDSIGNILDTLSIEYLKYDEKNRQRFLKKIYWYQDKKMSWKDYFKPDEDLFYRESFDESGQVNSIYETQSNKMGRVEKAIQIDYNREPRDTLTMDYSYELQSNGKLKKRFIKIRHKEVGDLRYKLIYDEYEHPSAEVLTFGSDTMNFQIWEYVDTILQKNVYTNYQRDTSKSVYFFSPKKILIYEEEYEYKAGEFIKSKEINYFYNESNDRIKSIEKNIKTEKIKYVRYLN